MSKLGVAPPNEALLTQLWKKFKAGDEKAFDQLVEMRYRVLFNYATRFTKDKDLIKDCLQDLLLELWSRRDTLVETPYVTIYLIKALRNNLFRKLKQEKRLDYQTDDWSEANETSDGATAESEWIQGELSAEQAQALRQLIEQLPKRQQEAIFLKYYEGLSNEEIAQIMVVERQTVANFLHRALNGLKNSLQLSGLLLLVLLHLCGQYDLAKIFEDSLDLPPIP